MIATAVAPATKYSVYILKNDVKKYHIGIVFKSMDRNKSGEIENYEEVVSDPDIFDITKSKSREVHINDVQKTKPAFSVVGDDTIFLSSDDEHLPLKSVPCNSKVITTRNSTPTLKPAVIQQSSMKASGTYLLDSFDSPLATMSLQDRLKEQDQPQHCPSKLLNSSSDSDCFSPIGRPYKKSLHVLCSSSDDEVSSPPECRSLTFKGRHTKTKTKDSIPKTIPESESELEDVFVSLTINEAPSVKPKKLKKPREKKKTQNTAVFVPPDSRSRPSFLASLSSDVPEESRHSDALPFFKNFRKRRDELTNRLFLMFNDEIFNNFFEPNFSITWNARLTRTAGYCRHFTRRENGTTTFESRIELSVKVVDTPCRLRDTLVHELCHAATWVIDNCRGGHGPVWRKWANQALDVYPELPPITRCHNYEITYKFYYNCVNCKYSAGRHSKSIDTTTHVCPMCRGKLELSKEPTSKLGAGAGQELSTPKAKTPRTPNAFALFVKDNYATVKSSRSDLPHAAVMKLLSAKFAESKKQVV
uniref:EOG090X0464 n=1 Tax=Ceriodaphnia reticulata TaxID=302197 RepID=A0A4Y7LZN1_9CRUS|nr:EOG090X0464 [Ceriodaphnia reticulata]SVE72863.1 EOG090X0464 [Ceriodaphnia reticulata]